MMNKLEKRGEGNIMGKYIKYLARHINLTSPDLGITPGIVFSRL
jgi:hypothetical protein